MGHGLRQFSRRASTLVFTAIVATTTGAGWLALAACAGDDTTAPPDGGMNGLDSTTSTTIPPAPRLEKPVVLLDASCPVTISSPELLQASHVDVGTEVTYNSNPPSSGPHYPDWASFLEFPNPVDRRYYVHSMEHGAVVLLYNCPSGCDDVVQGFRDLVKSLPDDEECTMLGDRLPRVRIVITPDPLLQNKVAAAAWGWTYVSDCFDKDSLRTFVTAHYAQGREDFCTPDINSF